METQKNNLQNGITQEYQAKLTAELNHLLDVERPEVIRQIQEAREQGDLSENADYDSARNRQAEIESRIQEIKQILENSHVLETPVGNVDKVSLMTYVTYEELDTKHQYQFQIIGNQGADPLQGIISSESPLGKALVGHKVGDVIEIKGVESPYSVKILKIDAKR